MKAEREKMKHESQHSLLLETHQNRIAMYTATTQRLSEEQEAQRRSEVSVTKKNKYQS